MIDNLKPPLGVVNSPIGIYPPGKSFVRMDDRVVLSFPVKGGQAEFRAPKMTGEEFDILMKVLDLAKNSYVSE